MNEFIESKYYDVWNRIQLAIREEDDDISEEGILPTTVDGVPIRKLFVCNLASRTTHKDLAARFSRYGNIESCFLKRNLSKNNYAFVTFSKVTEAMSARVDGEWKKITLHSRDLRVVPADSWHQPDCSENQHRPEKENSNKQLERSENGLFFGAFTSCDFNYSCINILNDDCLMHIFLCLPIVDRVRIERVCKRWQIISQETWRCMQSLDLSHANWGFRMNDKRRAINTPRLRKVLIRCGRFLNHINITDYSHELSSNALTIIGKLCKNIQTINVTALTVSAAGIYSLADNCSCITKFCLGKTSNTCEKELKKLFIQNANLQHFEVSKNNISGKCLFYLSNSLVELRLRVCISLGDCHLAKALYNFKNLRTLSIVGCIGISSRVMEAIGTHCNNLKTLELVGDFPVMLSEDMLHIIKLEGLESLQVGRNSAVTDNFLVELAFKCRQLKYIDINSCKFVTDAGVAALATLPRLESLILSYLYEITAEGLQEMCNLRELKCHGCKHLQDDGIISLIRHSPHLELLDLSGCVEITNYTLHIAVVCTRKRTHNTILKIYVGGTSIIEEFMFYPPFLQVVHVDLSIFGELQSMRDRNTYM